MKIRPSAGTMRGVRVVRDPLGILLDPFTDPIIGEQLGYVVVYAEGEPAVFDGETWHPVFEGDLGDWNSAQLELSQEQMMKIAQAAPNEPAYAELASRMGIYV